MGTIVLNGKLYDTVTGALVHAPAATGGSKPKVHKKSGLVMDGIVHSPKPKHPVPKVKKQPAPTKAAAHHAHNATHHTAAPAQRHKPQRAATLMRHAVSKPAHQPVHRQPASAHDERTAQRLERAKAVQKSTHIQRFPAAHASHAAHRSVSKKHAPLHVEAAPEPAVTAHKPKPSPVAAPLSASEKLVTNALKHARAHEATQPFAKKPKRRMAHALGIKHRTLNMGMAAIAVLVLVGFFVYQNIPSLSMRVASTRAGFSATQPGYTPSGFAQEKLVSYSPGKITISFRSNSDERNFQMTQQVSNWNSQALADNYLAVNNKQYQVYQAGGKTIYVYDGSNATWVNGGVWYQIEGKSSLTSEQLLRIANSI